MMELVPTERITGKIYIVRDTKVILDRDLADLYEVETKQVKRAVRWLILKFTCGLKYCFFRIHVDYGVGQDRWCKYSSLAI